MQAAMYNNVVIPSSNGSNGCYYYTPSNFDGSGHGGANAGSPLDQLGQQHQQSDAGNVDRTCYQSHGTAPVQQRTMLSPDLAPDLQCVGSDVPFYETDVVKKEMHYYEMQPIQNTTPQYNANSLLTDFFQNGNNDISDFVWEMTPSYQFKPPNQWSQAEVLDWFLAWSKSMSIDPMEVNMREFNGMDGQTLCSLSQNDFYTLDNQYGLSIYKSFQNEITAHYPSSQILLDIPQSVRNDNNNPLPEFNTWNNNTFSDMLRNVSSDLQGNSPSSSHDSDREDRESTSSSMSTANEKSTINTTSPFISSSLCSGILDSKKAGRRGRPPKTEARSSRNRQGKGNGKLWEFIRDLLLDPATNPSLIRWERPEDGIFKFVQSDRVAKMWGDRKQNPRMTYEKLSRAMRYYYKSQVLLPVFGRRLVYKFGPNATGWRHGPGYH